MKIAKDAFVFVIPLLVVVAGLWFVGLRVPALVFLLITLFILYFFRDPERRIPDDPLLVVSPADGKVMEVEPAQVNGVSHTRVGIFLSVFDVHINRAPIAGVVKSRHYQKGKFEAAYSKSASLNNEQNRLVIAGKEAVVEVVQIAGLIARRIVCYKKEGEAVSRGERIGLIRFGSKTDCLFPTDAEVLVRKGDRVRGAASPIARLRPHA
ncbi:MAG: phosphatidylserine decarboxylase family protein [Acidobacteriia bacterium]|nr:phosphatidylserine decarboxylase family protein [Terriglobia bacterium]